MTALAGTDARLTLSAAQVKAIVDDLSRLGEPLSAADAARVIDLSRSPSEGASGEIERLLALRTLARVTLDQQGIGDSVSVLSTPQFAELGWRSFLVRVENPFRLKGPLLFWSNVAIADGDLQPGIHEGHVLGNDLPKEIRVPPDLKTDYEIGTDQWLGYRMGSDRSDDHGLQGRPLEFQVLQLYCQRRAAGPTLMLFGSSILGRSPRLGDSTRFVVYPRIQPACAVELRILDFDGRGAMASLLIYDEAGRLLPAPAHRLEPDLAYQPHIYRCDGEKLRLPEGRYTVTAARGPEYLELPLVLDIPSAGGASVLEVRLQRWFNATAFGWYPGDPHLHPEGQHYGSISKLGLTPESMYRQVCGEALSVGSILIWAGGYYYEKQFLTGHVYEPIRALPFPEVQRENNVDLTPSRTPHDADSLIRYDVEQAAFPSNRLGHLVLLGLKNHNYPSARSVYDWPSWNLPILKWAHAQGAVCGYAHVGVRMSVEPRKLPSYAVPPLDGLGGNECLVDVTYGAVDFIAGGEGPPSADLNLWYHLLNCGFSLPMMGETDFVSWTARVGAARTYVKLDQAPRGDSGYRAWLEGVRSGRVYFGDGRSHFIDYRIDGRAVGEGPLDLPAPGQVILRCKVASRLDPTPFDVDARLRRDNVSTYWHVERARIGSSRNVPLEIVVNGHAVETHEILADGVLREITTSISVDRSSWIALRVLPSGHTMPIFVAINGEPIRVSRRSAQWCLDCLEVLWGLHAERIRDEERVAAGSAWDHARDTYRRILSECKVE